MPTEAVTGTKHMSTTKASEAKAGEAKAEPKPHERTAAERSASAKKGAKTRAANVEADAKAPTVDPQQGVFPRRNWTDDKGVVHHEERKPNEKVWREVEAVD